jgi:hypothetical protein
MTLCTLTWRDIGTLIVAAKGDIQKHSNSKQHEAREPAPRYEGSMELDIYHAFSR